MSEIHRLLDELNSLADSEENKRRLSLWDINLNGFRAETQWHSVPGYTADAGRPMPVTAECQDQIWQEIFDFNFKQYFTEPEYFLENYLKMKIARFREFQDDTPITRDIPVYFGVTHEAGIMGQEIFLDHGEEPTFSKKPYYDYDSDFSKPIDFERNDFLKMSKGFYNKFKQICGDEFNVIFPVWYRAPQGVALYMRGFSEFSMDLYLNEDFCHRMLRYITDTQMAYAEWRAEYTEKPIEMCDLFNDDIPIMSPEVYEKFFFSYEQELSDFFGGVHYWHSCGDITRHVEAVSKLKNVKLLDFGVTMLDKRPGIDSLSSPDAALELRVFAQPYVQECSVEESKNYIRELLKACTETNVSKYVIRSSGMSTVLGAEEDISKLARWVDLAREVQSEFT